MTTKKTHQKCFKCGGSDSATYFLDTEVVSCFSCGENYKHPDKEESVISDSIPRFGFEDMQHRGFEERKITKPIAEMFDVRVTYNSDGTISEHNYPYTKGSQRAGYKTRIVSPKSFRFTGGSIKDFELFGQSRGKLGKTLVITEGELDAMTVAQAQVDHYGKAFSVVSMSSATGLDHLVNNLGWIKSFDDVVLMLDNDEAGDKSLAGVSRAIGFGKVKVADLGKYKDPSDAYVSEGDQYILKAIWNAELYSPAGIISGEQVWDEYQKRKNIVSHPYPDCVGGLNDKLYGMRMGEIVLFTSGTGAGKSTLIKEIGLHLLDSTDHKIGLVSLEESPGDTAEKFIQMQLKKNFRNHEVTEEEERGAFDEVFGDNRMILLDHQGSVSDSGLMDKMHALAAMGCKYVILDHLTIAVSEGSDGLSGNEAIDKVMSDLLKLCKQYDIWLGVISHLRKVSGGQSFEEGKMPSLDDMKGSGSIKQIAFDVIAFSRNLIAETDEERDTVKLSVLKVRNGYTTGPAGAAVYNKDTCRLEGTDGAQFVEHN